ncbi:MAG: hypothetical protein QXK76_00850 [Candidatus Woesearchaeota archaeon]
MSLEKHINRILNLKVSEHIYVTEKETGVYANKKWVDEAGKRIILYYYDAVFDPEARKLPDTIKVKGKEFEIEYWKDQRPRIATPEELKELYERVKPKK